METGPSNWTPNSRAGRALPLAPLGFVVGVAAFCTVVLAAWVNETRVDTVALRLPVEEREGSLRQGKRATVDRNMGALIASAGIPGDRRGSWPRFRGPRGDNIARDVGNLARAWPKEGLRVRWSVELGEGHAGPAVHNGRVYVVDYDRSKDEDAIRCLSLADGAEIWRYTYYVKIKRNHGMSRTVPAVNDKYVVALGPMCHMHCLDAVTGARIWKLDLVKEFGTTVPPWYAGQCPLIDGDVAIIATGADPLIMAVVLASGRVRWKTPNPGGWGMTHSSVVALSYRGATQYVYCATRGVVGVDAEDGTLLWKYPGWKIALANVPTPVAVGGDRIFFSGGYNSGCAMAQLTGEKGSIQVEEVFRLKHTVFGSDQQTPILYDKHIYGVAPGGQMACLALDGTLMWKSGQGHRFGLGPYLLADGLLLILNDQKGTLHLAEATPKGYRELASANVLRGHDAWGPMAMVPGALLLRDLTQLTCLEVPVMK